MGTSDIVGAVSNAVSAINTWFHAPFRQTSYTPQTWFLLVGMLTIFFFFWLAIVGHMEREV